MAGTTGEEEASKARLRELGGILGETGQLGADMASMQVKTSLVNLEAAEVKFSDTMNRGNNAAAETQRVENRRAMARGGIVYASRGIFVPRGTDTVPAMLTPGEFVVNRAAVQRGNNLQMLQAMNNGSNSVSSDSGDGAALMSKGGTVRYRRHGSEDAEKPNSSGEGGMFGALSKFAFSLSASSAGEKSVFVPCSHSHACTSIVHAASQVANTILHVKLLSGITVFNA
jgi:hypothetical protein